MKPNLNVVKKNLNVLEKNSSLNCPPKKVTDLSEILVVYTPFNREIGAAEGDAAHFSAKRQKY